MTNESSIALLGLCLAGVLAVAGCQDAQKTEADLVAEVRPTETSAPKNVTLEGLGQDVRVGRAIVSAAAEGRPLHVIVPIHVAAEHELKLTYRFQFHDAERQSVGGEGRWRRLDLGPRLDVQIEAQAPHVDATDWRLTIRPAEEIITLHEQGTHPVTRGSASDR